MITKDEVMYLLEEETAICKHLFHRLPRGALDYRPAPGQRSLLELLRYLTICGSVGQGLVSESWDEYQELARSADRLPASGFPDAMDAQVERVRRFLDGIPEGEWASKAIEAPMGNVDPLSMAMVISPVRFLVAYRMQLFLYAKAAGATDLDTEDCWLKRT